MSLRIVVLGLSLSSSWGNGHATTYRALLKALARRGHDILFLEQDQPWYARHRDLAAPDFCRLVLYRDLADLARQRRAIAAADAVIIGSYVPDGIAVANWALDAAQGVTAFYDIDTPVTLARLARGDGEYLSEPLIRRFDVYLSFTGGPTLQRLVRRYGARAAKALYCSVDPEVYRPVARRRRWDLGYLGTYSADRQPVLERLLIEPARAAPELRFAVAGALYPRDIDWPANVERIEHVAPSDHPAFYSACRFTLNVTRAAMIRAGHSPSVRLFEAAACGTPIISDRWAGIGTILKPGREILLADGADDVLAALRSTHASARQLASRARARVLAEHTAAHRAAELETYLVEAARAARPRADLRRAALNVGT